MPEKKEKIEEKKDEQAKAGSTTKPRRSLLVRKSALKDASDKEKANDSSVKDSDTKIVSKIVSKPPVKFKLKKTKVKEEVKPAVKPAKSDSEPKAKSHQKSFTSKKKPEYKSNNNFHDKEKSGANTRHKSSFNSQTQRKQGGSTGSNFTQTSSPSPTDATKKRSFKATRKKQFVSKKNRDMEKALQFKNKPKVVQQTNPVPKSISIMENISVSELAKKMNLKASQLLSKLMDMGVMVSLNSTLDVDTVQLLASEYSCEVKIVSLYDQTTIETPADAEEDLQPRAPIVTVMGHVDHGKTTLLDTIRKTSIVDGEQGSITQHIGAYQVHVNSKDITFLDTPGHAAFSLMRARGAQLTDIVVLVVAANDGIKEQTKEAITHAKEAKVPIIVALNKIDLADANEENVYKELSEVELVPEAWGGDTIVCKISALKNEGIENLLEHIILSADLLELKANPNCVAEGKVIESKVAQGHGVVATVLIERGTLHIKDSFVAGIYNGRARLLLDDKGKQIQKAGPSTPVEVIGLEGIPFAGDPFQVTENEKVAKQISLRRQELARHESRESVRKITSDTLYSSMEESNVSTYKVIVKGDVYGSVEAIKMALEEIGNEEVKIQVISATAGTINESDVMLASASEAAIIGFHVRPSQKIQQLANQEKVTIYKFTVIFDIIDKMKEIVSGMLSPDVQVEKIGEVEVREIFTMSKVGSIAGSYVISGKVQSNSIVHVMRNGKKIAEDTIESLKRFQDNVKSVGTNYECGISLKETNDLQAGDILFIFEEKEVARNV